MLLFVLYACIRLLIDLALAPLGDCATDQAELLVLCYQLRVIERNVKLLRWRQGDRLVLAALTRRLPRPSWPTLLVKPEQCSAGTASWSEGSGRASHVVLTEVDPRSAKIAGS